MMFWDASAIIPLCVAEKHSRAVKRLLMNDPLMAVWWGTPLECFSAFARLIRQGEIDRELDYLRPLNELMKIWTEIKPGHDLRDIAFRIIATHQLKSADSLQLASAFIWSGKKPMGNNFVCLDKKLRAAAQKEGFKILPLATR